MDLTKAQFEGAAPAETKCAVCSAALAGQYWTAGAATVCASCAQTLQAGPPAEGGAGRFVKAVLFGAGAGLLGAVGYSLIIYFAKVELALVTIFIGWFVGRAMKTGTEGRGGRAYQVLAALMTYFFCMMAYVPTLVHEVTSTGDKLPVVLAVLLAPFLALIIPFTGEMGVLGTLILAFGVWQGWRELAKVEVPVAGPFELAPAVAPAVAEPPPVQPPPSSDAPPAS